MKYAETVVYPSVLITEGQGLGLITIAQVTKEEWTGRKGLELPFLQQALSRK